MARIEKRGKGRFASAEIALSGDMSGTPKAERFDELKQNPEDPNQYLEDMGDLLETPFYSLNKSVPQFRQEMISPDPRHWGVRWFFPNAVGGPVYVDHPQSAADLAVCMKKAKIMEKLKLNYKLFRPESERKFGNAMDMIEDGETLSKEAVF